MRTDNIIHNGQLQNFHFSSNIITSQVKEVRWAGHHEWGI